jgi:Skp family chaperone for outer membrane proteins
MTRMTIAGALVLSVTVPAMATAASGQARPPAAVQAQTPPPTQTPVPPLLPNPGTVPAPSTQAAAPLPFPVGGKVAVFDMQAVASQSKLGASEQKKLKALQDQQAAALSEKSKAIQALQQQIQQQGGVLGADALAQKKSELARLQREAQFAQQDAQAQMEAMDTQVADEFQARVLPVVEAVRAEKNLWAIFSAADAGFMAIHGGLDVSADVIKGLDAAYPGGR